MILLIFIIIALIFISSFLFINKKVLAAQQDENTNQKQLALRINLLTLAPILAVIILSIFIYNVHSLYEERISHALLVLGCWVIGTSSFLYSKYLKSKKNLTIFSVIIGTLSVSAAVYFTPLDKYAAVFHSKEYLATLIAGVLVLVIHYIGLTSIKRKNIQFRN